jgi:hypothetical protein
MLATMRPRSIEASSSACCDASTEGGLVTVPVLCGQGNCGKVRGRE